MLPQPFPRSQHHSPLMAAVAPEGHSGSVPISPWPLHPPGSSRDATPILISAVLKVFPHSLLSLIRALAQSVQICVHILPALAEPALIC